MSNGLLELEKLIQIDEGDLIGIYNDDAKYNKYNRTICQVKTERGTRPIGFYIRRRRPIGIDIRTNSRLV